MATANIYDLTDTWNDGATTFNAIKMNVTDTASAVGSRLLDLQVAATSQFSISKTGGITGLSNVLEVRNGTNAQALRVYNTFTDASNYERAIFDWTTTANTLTIGTLAAGTGAARNLRLSPSSGTIQIPAGNYITFLSGTGAINWANRVTLKASADGVFLFQNNAEADFTRLQLGGTTNAFGAIAKDGAGVSIVGGAGGSTAHIKVPGVTVANLPAAATAGAGARSFVTDALAPVFGSAVAGSGAVPVPVYSTGSAWNVG